MTWEVSYASENPPQLLAGFHFLFLLLFLVLGLFFVCHGYLLFDFLEFS